MRAYYFGVKLRLRWFCQGAGGQLTPLLRVQRIAFPGGLVGMGDGGDNQERVTGIEHGVGTREQRARRGTERSAGHRGDIQGMRAVAVLLVMLGHARISGLTGGYVGVDVFFVISGFLITGILVREVRRTGRISIVNFYARRARRILPAATVVLLAVVLVSSRLFNYVRVDQVTDQVTWAAFFAANLQLAGSGSDYFAVGTFVSPVQHYWSLAVEEQFYLVWPALIALILYAGRRGLSDRPNATSWRLRRLAVAIALLCAASFAWSVWYTTHQPLMAYYSAPARGWELGSGALLALCATRVARLPVPVKALASWLGLVAIAVAAVRFTPHTPPPGYQRRPEDRQRRVVRGQRCVRGEPHRRHRDRDQPQPGRQRFHRHRQPRHPGRAEREQRTRAELPAPCRGGVVRHQRLVRGVPDRPRERRRAQQRDRHREPPHPPRRRVGPVAQAAPSGVQDEGDQRRPDEVELLLDGQRPVVLHR